MLCVSNAAKTKDNVKNNAYIKVFNFALCFCIPSENVIYAILHVCGFYFGLVHVFRNMITSMDKRIPGYPLIHYP